MSRRQQIYDYYKDSLGYSEEHVFFIDEEANWIIRNPQQYESEAERVLIHFCQEIEAGGGSTIHQKCFLCGKEIPEKVLNFYNLVRKVEA